MAIAEQVSFTLLRFEWTPPDQLDVAGTWAGVDKSDLSEVTLVLHGRGSVHRLAAIRGVSGNSRNWSAGFAWRGDPESVERAELVLGDSLIVELPSSSSKRRRFGRTPLPVRELPDRSVPPDGSADADALALHALMVAAQDEAAEARDELERLQAETERAREQAKRERARRESDVARLQESMTSLRRLAESSLEKEREATRGVTAHLDELEASVSGFRSEAARQSELAQAAVAERDQAAEQLRLQEPEVERLRARLDQLARDSRELSERSRTEVQDARAEVQQARGRLATVEAELVSARAAGVEADELRSQLAGAQDENEQVRAEVERLKGKLATLREVFDQSM